MLGSMQGSGCLELMEAFGSNGVCISLICHGGK